MWLKRVLERELTNKTDFADKLINMVNSGYLTGEIFGRLKPNKTYFENTDRIKIPIGKKLFMAKYIGTEHIFDLYFALLNAPTEDLETKLSFCYSLLLPFSKISEEEKMLEIHLDVTKDEKDDNTILQFADYYLRLRVLFY